MFFFYFCFLATWWNTLSSDSRLICSFLNSNSLWLCFLFFVFISRQLKIRLCFFKLMMNKDYGKSVFKNLETCGVLKLLKLHKVGGQVLQLGIRIGLVPSSWSFSTFLLVVISFRLQRKLLWQMLITNEKGHADLQKYKIYCRKEKDQVKCCFKKWSYYVWQTYR